MRPVRIDIVYKHPFSLDQSSEEIETITKSSSRSSGKKSTTKSRAHSTGKRSHIASISSAKARVSSNLKGPHKSPDSSRNSSDQNIIFNKPSNPASAKRITQGTMPRNLTAGLSTQLRVLGGCSTDYIRINNKVKDCWQSLQVNGHCFIFKNLGRNQYESLSADVEPIVFRVDRDVVIGEGSMRRAFKAEVATKSSDGSENISNYLAKIRHNEQCQMAANHAPDALLCKASGLLLKKFKMILSENSWKYSDRLSFHSSQGGIITIPMRPERPLLKLKLQRVQLEEYQFLATPLNLQENTELIQYYLLVLKLRRKEEIANYRPTPWELLSTEEKRQLALHHIRVNEQERIIGIQIIQALRHEYYATKKISIAAYRAEKLAKAAKTFVNDSITNSPVNPVRDLHGPLPTGAATRKRAAKLRGPGQQTLTNPDPKEVGSSSDSKYSSNHYSNDFRPSCKGAMGENDASERAEHGDDGLAEHDGSDERSGEYGDRSHSLRIVGKYPLTSQISGDPKEEKITLLVKAHVVLWNQCVAAQASGATDELKVLLNSAQDSQKALQKLIKKAEVEEFTKGWNPWEIKKQLFPKDNNGKGKAKNNGGKARSLASKNMMKYNNQEGWDDVFDLTYTLRGAFNSAKKRRLN
ncbi:hypothetical protein PSTT_02347 [Puccinia striiformis]|uniref:Uncharacterized protein n=1 Tax=Puccinia striiformis TaxID=27350 RepID=A0A2S4W078_9BASI|nr:hypothetical protein PSTT_02347 [Puccinia striiformis]